MKVSFLDADHMVLEFHEGKEREVLRRLLVDAGRGTDPLIVDGMRPEEEAEEWDEWVRPELEETFKGQIECVAEALADEPETIEIERQHFDLWYGALNQSRLALELKWGFAGVDDVQEVISWEEKKREAFMRFQLALALQSTLLDAMDLEFGGDEADE